MQIALTRTFTNKPGIPLTKGEKTNKWRNATNTRKNGDYADKPAFPSIGLQLIHSKKRTAASHNRTTVKQT